MLIVFFADSLLLVASASFSCASKRATLAAFSSTGTYSTTSQPNSQNYPILGSQGPSPCEVVVGQNDQVPVFYNAWL